MNAFLRKQLHASKAGWNQSAETITALQSRLDQELARKSEFIHRWSEESLREAELTEEDYFAMPAALNRKISPSGNRSPAWKIPLRRGPHPRASSLVPHRLPVTREPGGCGPGQAEPDAESPGVRLMPRVSGVGTFRGRGRIPA